MLYGGDPQGGIPAVAWTLKDGFDTRGYTLYDLADRLRSRGWQVPAYSLPADCRDMVIQRILVRHGVSRDLGALLIDDIKRCLDFFGRHPITRPMTAEEGTGYHH
jgi:glutamate decarboxylase